MNLTHSLADQIRSDFRPPALFCSVPLVRNSIRYDKSRLLRHILLILASYGSALVVRGLELGWRTP